MTLSETSGWRAGDDSVLPFAVEALHIRGRLARLGPSLDSILRRHAYPPAVARALGEAAVLGALLGSTLKSDGRFQLQTKTDGALGLLVVDFDMPDRLRAFARFTPGAAADSASTGTLLGRGHLALTIEDLKATVLESLAQEPVARAIPHQTLHAIATAIEENEQVA